MKSPKEISIETKIINKLQKYKDCTKLAKYLMDDVELQEMQDYANNVSIKRLGFNDHGPVHMRQVANNAIKMLNILHDFDIQTSIEKEEIGTFEDSLCAVVVAGLMHDLGMMIGRQSHEDMSTTLAIPIIDRALQYVFGDDIHKKVIIKSLAIEAITQIPTDEYEQDHVACVMQKGYKIGDRIIRPALVGVAKKKEDE